MKYIHNLSKEKFDDITYIALSKNPNFIPQAELKSTTELIQDFKNLSRQMRLKYLMQDAPKNKQNPFKKKSTYVPTPTCHNSLEEYLWLTETELRNLMTRTTPNAKEAYIGKTRNNMSKQEMEALKKLKKNTNIIIKRQDKGTGIVILQREDYIECASKRLCKQQYYKVVPDPMIPKICSDIKELVERMATNNEINQQTKKYLIPDPSKCRVAELYLLPKIHKGYPPLQGRPIISGCESATEKISAFLDHHLIDLVKDQTTYLRDTKDFINRIEKSHYQKDDILVAADISDMYSNIIFKEALEIVKNRLSCQRMGPRALYEPENSSLVEMLSLILTSNVCHFNSKYYLQVCGLAMGSKCSCSVSDIAVYPFESTLINMHSNIMQWLRFRDDVFFIWRGDHPSLKKFTETANSLHPTLKFEFEISDTSVNFLDLTIYKGPRFLKCGTLDLRVYQKKTDTNMHLEPHSAHPPNVFKSMMMGESQRFIRNSSSEENYIERLSKFKMTLAERGHDPTLINKYCSLANYNCREEYLKEKKKGNTDKNKEAPLVFITKYDNRFVNLKNAFTKHWHIIEKHPELNYLFKKPPLMAYKRQNNIADMISEVE